ncbi:MAG: alpha/beta fold hydrolase [Spirochaetales bacterium]|nr:alpha/beta fold hydrolase [Spirochaetales bacterium]
MKLSTREFGGEGFPVVILHGLFASSKNWLSAARFLSGFSRPFALDLRNHGDSPHSESHSLEDMIADLREWLQERQLNETVLLGHSMGGLVAMGFALSSPQSVRGLIVVDILPRAYRIDFSREFEALSLDLSPYESRGEIDEAMAEIVPELQVRQFLQMNVERREGGFYWKLNVPALRSAEFLRGPDFSVFQNRYEGPALLVAGGESPFARADDLPLFNRYFPNGRIEVLKDCGHWLHYICSQEFQSLVREFIEAL